MKTKVEINGYEIEIEEKDGMIIVKAEKDDEVVEEFTIEMNDESEESQSQEDSDDNDEKGEIQSFGDFGQEEEDFDSESQSQEEDEDDKSENAPALESFQSFMKKNK